MTAPSITVSIDRSGMPGTLAPLVFSASLSDSSALGLINYQAPGRQARVTYAPDSINIHGSEAIGAAWQQAILGFDWVPDTAASETEVQAAFAEVVAAVGQFSYVVTTQVSGAPAQAWRADMGSVGSVARSYMDLVNLDPVYPVSIPVYPIAS